MPSTLFRRLAPLALVASLTMLGGCATGPDVVAEYDRSVDFRQYKTFGFFSPLGTDRGGYQTLVSQYLKASTQRQLEARGLTLDNAAPQLRVNFSARLDEKLRATTLPGPAWGMGYYGYRGGYYGYRGGLYAPWPLYYDQTLVMPYNEGTLNIDLVDMVRKQMVWEGVVVGTVTEKDTENLQAAIDRAVTAAFGKFPIPGPAPLPAPLPTK